MKVGDLVKMKLTRDRWSLGFVLGPCPKHFEGGFPVFKVQSLKDMKVENWHADDLEVIA